MVDQAAGGETHSTAPMVPGLRARQQADALFGA
jgi:hypothetical protein